MASYNKGSQENINPEQELMNNNNKSSVKSAARQRNTHFTSRPAHISSKPQIKRIQNLDRNTSSSTSISESNFSQYSNGENQFTKRPITGRKLTNVLHNIQSHSNSKTAEVASQHKVLDEHAPSPKRQRLETVDNANNVYTIEERMKEIHYGVQTQPQATVPVTKESIPANLTTHTGPEVPPKLANTPSGLEREQQNNENYTFARELTQNNNEDFFKSLKLDDIKSRRKELTKLESEYRNNVDSMTYSEVMQELKKKINILKQGIEQSEKIRLHIAESEAILRLGKYTCIRCKKGYEKPGNIFNHILASHPKIVEEYKPAQINDTASTVIHDTHETCTLISNSHSINSSQLTMLDGDVSTQGVASAALKLPKEQRNQVQTKTNQVRANIPVSSGRNVIVNASSKHVPVTTTNSRIFLQTTDEIRHDHPLWKRIKINFVPRKPVDFLGHKSFELFEKNERRIMNWMKKSRSNNVTIPTNEKKNIIPRVVSSGKNTTLHDSSVQVYKYYLDLLYTKAELQIIKHCYIDKKTDDLCNTCVNKLVEFQAKQYAVSRAAYNEHEKISKDTSLSSQEKKRKIKELVSTRDEYSLIRERLDKVNAVSVNPSSVNASSVKAKRGSFNFSSVVVKYNRNYFALLENAFNDMDIQDYVQLNKSNRPKYNLGIYCSKLMDDIANEFLVQVTVICMNFAYQQHKVTLTKELLSQYQASFKMTNKDATYLEHCPPKMGFYLAKNYSKFVPKGNDLEILIIDCLLRHCFSDENTMHKSLDDLIFEHLKSPQPIFKFLMYMKFTKPYLEMISSLLLVFLFQLSVEVLKLKKGKDSDCSLVTFEELIEACEIVGVFGSSYIHYLRKSYTQYFEAFVQQSWKQ